MFRPATCPWPMATILALALLLPGCVDRPQPRARPALETRASPLRTLPNSGGQCLSQLGLSRAAFTPLPDRYFGAGCSQLGTVELGALTGDAGTIRLANLGPVTCPLAEALAGWARFGVDRAARQILGSGLARIDTMGSYSCRNVAGTARRSGHASANAVDVAGFTLTDGRTIRVLGGWNDPDPAIRRFFRVVHASAGKRFGTVLGPDYNAAHANHLHVEVGSAYPIVR